MIRGMSIGINLPFVVGISPTLSIRGLIANEKISKNQIIEQCPALIYRKNPEVIEQTIFDNYVFDWDEQHEAMALGYGSLCNHSYTPNASVDYDMKANEVIFSALRDIEIGEEIMINYNDDTGEEIDVSYLNFDQELNN